MSGALWAMEVTISATRRGVAKVEMFARWASPSPFRRASSSALLIAAAIHSSAGLWKLAGSSSVPISNTRSMSPTLRPPGLPGAAHGLVREQLGVAGQVLFRGRPVPGGGGISPGPARRGTLPGVGGGRWGFQGVALALGYG